MRFARSGRLVFVLHWFLALLLWAWVLIGRGILGVELGWMAVIGIMYSVFIVPALYLPPVVTLFDGEARRARTVRSGYAIASVVVWASLFLMAFFVSDGGDAAPMPSWASLVFGMSDDDSGTVWLLLLATTALGWLASIGFAIAGIVRSVRLRRAAAAA